MRKKKIKHSCAKVHKKSNYPKFYKYTFHNLVDDMRFYKIPLDWDVLLGLGELYGQLRDKYDLFILEHQNLSK